MAELRGRRVLVVGASSGIGRAVLQGATAAGACVAGAARRCGLVRDALAGGAGAALTCDVRDPGDCTRVVDDAITALGGLDALVYATGVSRLGFVENVDAPAWHDILATNVVGAALVTAAALPHLSASRGRAVYLSSHSVPAPWPGLVPYAASKAALEALVAGLRAEHPDVTFTRVVVGPTLTAFADGWDPAVFRDVLSRWAADGYFDGTGAVPPEQVAQVVLAAIGAAEQVTDVSAVGAG